MRAFEEITGSDGPARLPRRRFAPRRIKVLSVVGTRPNFVKTIPVVAELRRRSRAFEHVLVHTGQHYDHALSEIFLQELGAPEPDHLLGVGSGSHAQQTARAMERLETVLIQEAPDLVLVPGDVNSSLAAALAAAKLGIRIGHIEAGLRSFDRTMPEEINRVLVDALAELLFVHSPEAVDNLVREGAAPESIHMVGNTMIDSLVAMRARIRAAGARRDPSLAPGSYVVVTLHRPALVDGALLGETLAQLEALSRRWRVVFPVHPRTRARLAAIDGALPHERLILAEPMGYVEFLALAADAAAVLTDSGGIQEETTFLGVPCFTMRDNTERPITISHGTNHLIGLAPDRIAGLADLIDEARSRPAPPPPPLWDGGAAGRIADVLQAAMRAPAAAAAVRADG